MDTCCVCSKEIRPRLFEDKLLGRPVHHRCKGMVLDDVFDVSFCSFCDTYPKLGRIDGKFWLQCSCGKAITSNSIIESVDLWNEVHKIKKEG